MSVTGLYFIPSNSTGSISYSTIQERLSQLAVDAGSSALPPWGLTHRLFFDTSSLLPTTGVVQSAIPPRRYLQFLVLSQHRSGSMFVGASPLSGKGDNISQQANGTSSMKSGTDGGGEGMNLISIPVTNAEDFFYTIQNKMQPLWAVRMIVRVENGSGFEIGDWKIRVGEVKQTGGAGQARVRGCVVEATMAVVDDGGTSEREEIGTDQREELLKEIWDRLQLEEGKAFVNVPGIGIHDDGFDLTRQYMELLRFTRAG